MQPPRTEHDTLGPVEVPAEALWGAQTQRALANFAISARPLPPRLIVALVRIKRAAALVHAEAGRLPAARAQALVAAADEVLAGQWDTQFPVDRFQTGSGTSSNMNVNEVLARRASQLLGAGPPLHPNDEVNLGQSSNDVFPSAIHLAAAEALQTELLPALHALTERFHSLADQHFDTVKLGRTHLMDAMPIRFGQEFRGHAQQCAGAGERLAACLPELSALALGGTAVGTGVNAPEGFAAAVCAQLSQPGGLAFHPSRRPFQAQSSLDAATHLSGCLRGLATSLSKICNDLRWMASGPHAGLAELDLPAVQPGSSIMPAKVNPVIPEAVLMLCAQVQGLDLANGIGNASGQFQLNTMLPLVGSNLVESLEWLAAACRILEERCLRDCAPRPGASDRVADHPILVTALAPEIGYEAAAALAKEAAQTGRSLRELAREQTALRERQLDELLDPRRLCGERGRTREESAD